MKKLNEISKKTLASYIGVASIDKSNHAANIGFENGISFSTGKRKDKAAFERMQKLHSRRSLGIQKAVKKLAKEEMSPEELVDALLEEFTFEEVEAMINEAQRMSTMWPRELMHKYLDHVEGSNPDFSGAHKQKRHGQAMKAIERHVKREGGPEAHRALKRVGRTATSVDRHGYFNADKHQDACDTFLSVMPSKPIGEYKAKNAKGKVFGEGLEEQSDYKSPGFFSRWLAARREKKQQASQRIEPKFSSPVKREVEPMPAIKKDIGPSRSANAGSFQARKAAVSAGKPPSLMARLSHAPDVEASHETSPAHSTLKTATRTKPLSAVKPAKSVVQQPISSKGPTAPENVEAERARRQRKARETFGLRKTFGVEPGRRRPIGEERIDELSKETLGRYVKRAHRNLEAGSFFQGAQSKWNGARQMTNRSEGIDKAVDRLTGTYTVKKGKAKLYGAKYRAESVEQIDEISKKTLKSYVGKAKKSRSELSDKAWIASNVGATATATDAKVRAVRRSSNIDKAKDRLGGLMHAKKRSMSYKCEEVEPLEEISKHKLHKYGRKALASLDYNPGETDADRRKENNRKAGIGNAMDRLAGMANFNHRYSDHHGNKLSKKLKVYYNAEEVEPIEERAKAPKSVAHAALKKVFHTIIGKRKKKKSSGKKVPLVVSKNKKMPKGSGSGVKVAKAKKAGASNALGRQTADLRKTFKQAPGKRFKNKPIPKGSKRKTTLVKEELLKVNEDTKLRLRKGMTQQEFNSAKKAILAKQTAAQKSATLPKPQFPTNGNAPPEVNRGDNMLKGHYPWGTVTPQLAKSALARLKMIEKPADRLHAMNSIWDSQHHFHSLVKTGRIGHGADGAPVKAKITLPKVSGVND